jgi:hypothetical protein
MHMISASSRRYCIVARLARREPFSYDRFVALPLHCNVNVEALQIWVYGFFSLAAAKPIPQE